MAKLYLAILNKGWLRREISSVVLPQMNKTKGVELVWEDPAKSWGHPISSNRNAITKRFLASDCDFLIMLDDDVIPQHNPAELVWADKDIIGSPAKVRQAGRCSNWVAYMKAPGDIEGYYPVDFTRVDADIDLLKVDIVGTGCILIRRNVLEELKAPFHCEYDDDGISKYGTDFAFCRKASAAGFEIYTTPQRRCEHVKEVGLCDITGYDDSDGRDGAAGKYRMPWGQWSITQGDWEFIKGIMEKEKVADVLEFGCGLSSLLMNELAYVRSYETNEEYAAEIINKGKNEVGEASSNLRINQWDGKSDIGKTTMKFHLAFIDGPRGKCSGGPGREHSFRIAAEHSDRIIVHDAGRQEELHWQDKYLRGKFKLVSQSGHHRQRCNYWVRKSE